jgi:hypothetical protein
MLMVRSALANIRQGPELCVTQTTGLHNCSVHACRQSLQKPMPCQAFNKPAKAGSTDQIPSNIWHQYTNTQT